MHGAVLFFSCGRLHILYQRPAYYVKVHRCTIFLPTILETAAKYDKTKILYVMCRGFPDCYSTFRSFLNSAFLNIRIAATIQMRKSMLKNPAL